MSEIDWSKAPAWATHHVHDKRVPSLSGAFVEIIDGKVYRYTPADRSKGAYVNPHAWRKLVTVARPRAWNGEGLPPVGTVCEYAGSMECLKPGDTVEIIYHFNAGMAEAAAFLYWHCGGRYVGLAIADCFRPIRTPEQIAAEERQLAVDEMVTVWKRTMGRFAQEERGLAEMLYDAGYRKTEEPKP